MNKEDKEIRKALNIKYPTPQFQQKDWQSVVIKRISNKPASRRHIGWWIAAAVMACLILLTFTLCPKTDIKTVSSRQIIATNNSRPEKTKQPIIRSIKQKIDDKPIAVIQQKHHHQTHVKVLTNTTMTEDEIAFAINKNKEDFNRQIASFYTDIESDIEKYNRDDDIKGQISSIYSEINLEIDKLNREVTAQNAEVARMMVQLQYEQNAKATNNQ
jgi:hypothetical protein